MNCNPTNTMNSSNANTNLSSDDANNADNHSTTSSTDDYVRELLDPNDRPRNVWHVVEGPKSVGSEGEGEASVDNDNNNNQSQTSPLSSPPPPPPPPPPPEEDDETVQAAGVAGASGNQPETNDEARKSPQSVGDRASEKSRTGRSSSSRHHRHRDDERRDHRKENRDQDRERNRHRDREPDRDRERDRERDRGHKRDRRHDDYRSSKRRRDHSDDEGDSSHRRHRRQSSRSSRRDRSGSRTSTSRRRDRSRSNSHSPLTKRNSRTILIMQLNPRVTSEDLEDFFAVIGKVKEVRLIIDSKTRKHKGIAYIEFEDADSAAKAFTLNGQDFFGAPINIQSAHSDRIRSSGDRHSSTSHTNNNSVNYHHHASTHSSSRSNLPPNCYRVYVGGLHVNLTEEMLRSLFEPFGPIVRLELMRDRTTNVSRGYAFITYANTEDGQEAVRCLDSFELAGKPMRVSKSTDKSERHTGTDSIIAG